MQSKIFPTHLSSTVSRRSTKRAAALPIWRWHASAAFASDGSGRLSICGVSVGRGVGVGAVEVAVGLTGRTVNTASPPESVELMPIAWTAEIVDVPCAMAKHSPLLPGVFGQEATLGSLEL